MIFFNIHNLLYKQKSYISFKKMLLNKKLIDKLFIFLRSKNILKAFSKCLYYSINIEFFF